MTCNPYDVGLWVRHHSDVFLKTCDETGACVLSYQKATPEALEVLLDELDRLTDKADERISELSSSVFNVELNKLRFTLQHWRDDLKVYRGHVDTALAEGAGPGAVWDCVAAPLLIGWYPNADCTGPSPLQETQGQPAVAEPLKLLNGAMCLQESNEHASAAVADYFQGLQQGLGDVAADLARAAGSVADAAASVVSAAKPSPLLVIVVGGVGGYLLYRLLG